MGLTKPEDKMMAAPGVLTLREGGVGRLRLNRPSALHALDHAMCAAMLDALLAWAGDPAVRAVVVDHAEGRGFCAGGDIRMLAASAAEGGEEARAFFRLEYQLNHLMFTYPKPIVALMDGITMGGGVGIALPAKIRVATERTRLAMPETGIGLFADVGGGWYLSRLPGRMGEFLALTGHRIDGAECRALGMATHYVESAALPDLTQAIAAGPGRLDVLLGAACVPVPGAAILGHQDEIDRLFTGETLEEVLAALEADGGEWATAQRQVLAAKSPLSMKVCLKLVRESRKLTDFADEMRLEFAIGSRIIAEPDFVEGVRSVIVDKDHAPHWNPAAAEGVSAATVDAIFAPLAEGEAWHPAA